MTGRAATSETPASEVVDPGLLDAARVLRETLGRVHPSFRFEERLADRLAARWGRAAASDAEDDHAMVIPFPVPAPVGAIEGLSAEFGTEDGAGAPALAEPRALLTPRTLRAPRALPAPRDLVVLWGQVPRGALIGGAIASGFSLAGAALLARRWRHRPARPVDSGRGAA